MVPNCSYPESVKCNTCGLTGHIAPACARRQNVQAISSSPFSTSSPAQLTIAYDGGSNFPSDRASA